MGVEKGFSGTTDARTAGAKSAGAKCGIRRGAGPASQRSVVLVSFACWRVFFLVRRGAWSESEPASSWSCLREARAGLA